MKKFNLIQIKKSLVDFKGNFQRINRILDVKREDMTMEIISNIIESYNYLNNLLNKNIDMFSPAGLYSMMELNHIVLCGIDPIKRYEYHKHIQETRKRFQDNIKPIVKWYKKEKVILTPLKIATIFYIQSLSQPQLFIEGNHRTENIILNYVLITHNKPPFILDTINAKEYFNRSSKIKFSNKGNMVTNLTEFPTLRKEIKKLLEKYIDEKYLY